MRTAGSGMLPAAELLSAVQCRQIQTAIAIDECVDAGAVMRTCLKV